jgi:hypothetical protein
MQKKLISMIGEDLNLSKINREFIASRSNNDELIKHIINNFKVLENIPYIKMIDSATEVIDDESKFPERKIKNVNETRMKLLKLHFSIDFKNEHEDVEVKIFIPKMYNYNYLLNGTKYFPIYQLVDRATYNTKDAVILKSVLHPIIVKKERLTFKFEEGEENSVYMFVLSLFKRKINILNYFLSEYGFEKTIEILGFDGFILLVKDDEYVDVNNEWNKFRINKNLSIWFAKSYFETDQFFAAIVTNFIHLFNKKISYDNITSQEYWTRKLGSVFTKNLSNQLEKGLSAVEAIITPKVEEKQNVPVVSQGTNLAVSDPKVNPPSLFDVLQEDLVGFVRTTIDRTNAEKDLKELVSNTLTTRIKSDACFLFSFAFEERFAIIFSVVFILEILP